MQPRIENLPTKNLIGLRVEMSLSENKTSQLWQSFMPRRNEISNTVNQCLYSLQVYSDNYHRVFNPETEFEKWALIEVEELCEIPKGMEPFKIEAGSYAVFDYKGSSTDLSIYQYIFQTWLPSSEYVLDARPHFELLGANYKNNDPASEEEIWIPIKIK